MDINGLIKWIENAHFACREATGYKCSHFRRQKEGNGLVNPLTNHVWCLMFIFFVMTLL